MLKLERQKKIKECLLNRKKMSVREISDLLQVTQATVRTDLTELEAEGYLVRSHGGAVLNEIGYDVDEMASVLRAHAAQNNEKKDQLGTTASSLVGEREWIFLGPGTTTYHIAKALARRNGVHVLTNSLLVANAMGSNPSCEVRLLGGTIHSEGLYTQPSELQNEMKGIFLNKAFFSVDGAELSAGYTLSDVNVLDLFRVISANCDETYMAVDTSKFGKRAFMRLSALNFPHKLITNTDIPDDYREYYALHHIPVLTGAEE